MSALQQPRQICIGVYPFGMWCTWQVMLLLFPTYQVGTSTFRFHVHEWLVVTESRRASPGNSRICNFYNYDQWRVQSESNTHVRINSASY